MMPFFCQAPPVGLGLSLSLALPSCNNGQRWRRLSYGSHKINRQLRVSKARALPDRTKHCSTSAVAINDDVARTWHTLFGMSFSDVYRNFPESVWDICQDPVTDHETESDLESDDSPNHALNFDDKFIESILSDRELYKYEIEGTKNNAHKLMKKGHMSASNKDEIFYCLQKIEEEIDLGTFEWKDDEDVHTNIIRKLSSMVGEKAKQLTSTSPYDRCLNVLHMRCKESTEQLISKIKQLQVALVLLIIKNEGLFLTKEKGNCSLLEDFLLRSVEELEYDASGLRSPHWCATSPLADRLRKSYLRDEFERYPIFTFAQTISSCIPDHLIKLVKEFSLWRSQKLLLPNDDIATYDAALQKICPDKQTRRNGIFSVIGCLNLDFQGPDGLRCVCNIKEAKYNLFSDSEIVLEMLDLCKRFAEATSFDAEKVQPSPARAYSDSIIFAQFLRSQGLPMEMSYALVHFCLEKKCQPSELTLDELQGIFPVDHVHDMLQDKSNIFDDFSHCDQLKKILKWCCKLQVDPMNIC